MGDEELDRHFLERLTGLVDAPARSAHRPSGPYEDHDERSIECDLGALWELFEAQATSRHLDFAARALKSVGRSFYTIGSAGHEGNAALAEADKPRVSERLAEVRAMLHVLGLDAALQTETGQDERAVIDSLVALALEQRASARERKDYAAADAIRSQLSEAGIVVEDTPAGARWQLRRD